MTSGVLAPAGLLSGLARCLQWAFLVVCLFRLASLLPQMLLAPRVGTVLHVAAAVLGPAAVITVDLDRPKQVNDAHGHAPGDALLVAVVTVRGRATTLTGRRRRCGSRCGSAWSRG